MYYIGVDLGTSALKLVMMDSKGELVKSVSKEYPLDFPHSGWSEQNPTDWFLAVKEGLREISVGAAEKIAGISFGGQMHGLVILDKDDNVLRPAILWNDGRSTEETDYLNNVIGKEKLSELTANIAFAGFTAPKILWVKKNEPEIFEKISKIMLPKDYISYMLSGNFSTDYSDASGMLLLDVKNKKWSHEMIDICGISEDMLPKLYESYEIVGYIRPELAKELGLNDDIKIIAGAGDNAAAAIGTGTVGEGACNISLGTSGTIFISSKNFGVDKYNALHSFDHADGNYHLMGCMLSAASCNKWWMEDILKTKDFSKEQENIGDLGENKGLYFLTSYESRKCRQMIQNPYVSALFYWPSFGRQVRLEGSVLRVEDDLNNKLFARYNEKQQLAAWSFPQSQTVATRKYLETLMDDFREDFSNSKKIARPSNYGAYCIQPQMFEFWQAHRNLLHDRLQYTLFNGTWKLERLAP